MYISGLQKLTLLDYPEHLAAILFLDGCNFRCPFCHNSELVLHENYRGGDFDVSSSENENVYRLPEDEDDLFSEDEVLGFLKKRAGMLDGVCISGGEPTLHRDLPDLIARIKELGYEVKLDTNGTNPDMLRRLLDENLLDYIAMDIKAGRKNYAAAAGISKNTFLTVNHSSALSAAFSKDLSDNCSSLSRGLLSRVQRSIDIIRNSGIDYEFRTTVVKGIHTEEDFEDIAQWLACKTPEPDDSAAVLSAERTRASAADNPISDLPVKDKHTLTSVSSQTPITKTDLAGKDKHPLTSGSSQAPITKTDLAGRDKHAPTPGSVDKPWYYLQSFRDCDTILLPDHHFSAFTEEEMLRFLAIIKKTIPNASLRGMEP